MNPKQVTTPSGSERSFSTGRGKDGVSSAFLKARFMTYKRRVWANYLPLVNSDWHENGHGNLSAPVLFLTNLLNTFTQTRSWYRSDNISSAIAISTTSQADHRM